MEKEFNELKLFLSEFWSYNITKIKEEYSLDDLGMYGDDKRDFLKAFFEKFDIDSEDMNYEKFCEPEIFNPLSFIFKKMKNEKIKIPINHLVSVIKKRKWFDPT
ncbi:MAG: DUF1493 family protein [Flavobacterium sp.]|jgi:hypothetical protein|nr:DUF1493 family protein [Flavobacterium sp.]